MTLPCPVGARLLAVLTVSWSCVMASAPVSAADEPVAVPRLAAERLAGDWYEIATTGSFWHRRCVTDTRYRFDQATPRGLRAAGACTTATGVDTQHGRLRAASGGDGRLSVRFAPVVFAWLPATWSDFWVLDAGAALDWLLVGDNRRERLLILSRTVVLDDASIAAAHAEARRQGYDPARLAMVPHPAGPTGLDFRH